MVRVDVVKTELKYIKEKLDEIHKDVKKNSEFRLKFGGVISAVAFISSIVGAFVMQTLTKLFK